MLEEMREPAAGDEERYIEAARSGDLSAFNWLVLRYQTRVYNLCYRMLSDPAAAADATQEAFISAYKAIETFKGGQFRAWVLRIASNACLDMLRSMKRRPATSLDRPQDPDGENEEPLQVADFDPWVDPEMRVLNAEMVAVLQQALDSLPDEQRIALILVDVQGLSYDEVVAVTGSNLGTVKSRINRARLKVRDYLLARGISPTGKSGELSKAEQRSIGEDHREGI